MDKNEIKELAKQMYRIYGKIREIDPKSLPDKRYQKTLATIEYRLSSATVEMECLAHTYIREDPEEYLDFNKEIYEIKETEVYK